MKLLAWEDDHWNSQNGSYMKYDKLEHFLLGFIGLLVTLFVFGMVWQAFASWITIAILYEVYNGLVPYDGTHIEGFSFKDLLADCYGFLAAVVLYLVFIQVRLSMGI